MRYDTALKQANAIRESAGLPALTDFPEEEPFLPSIMTNCRLALALRGTGVTAIGMLDLYVRNAYVDRIKSILGTRTYPAGIRESYVRMTDELREFVRDTDLNRISIERTPHNEHTDQ